MTTEVKIETFRGYGPWTSNDWLAHEEGACGCLDCRGSVRIGYGRTEEEAIADLKEKLEEA